MRPRLLLLLPQRPSDPASGAARNLLTASEMLTRHGWDVRAMGTSADERGSGRFLPRIQANRLSEISEGEWHEFVHRSIPHRLLDVGEELPWTWQERFDDAFDRGFHRELGEFKPDVIYTFGGDERARRRMADARRRGCSIVFGLQNLSYLDRRAFEQVDSILCCSESLRRHYYGQIGLQSVALPVPLDPADVVAETHQRIFVTMINPSLEKGLMFHARICEELGRRRPDIPILTVGSRATADHLAAAGNAGGFDLRRHASLMYSSGAANPKGIFTVTRVLLVPSIWQEPAGRVACEALVNGIPPIVSDRGGLPEVSCGGGFVLPLPPHLTTETRVPSSAAEVQPWCELIERLVDDEPFYASACERAQLAGNQYAYDAVAAQYDAHFRSLLPAKSDPR